MGGGQGTRLVFLSIEAKIKGPLSRGGIVPDKIYVGAYGSYLSREKRRKQSPPGTLRTPDFPILLPCSVGLLLDFPGSACTASEVKFCVGIG